MPDQNNQPQPQIEGLPPGATLQPTGTAARQQQQQQQRQQQSQQIEGLPPGATLQPTGTAARQQQQQSQQIEGLPPGAIVQPVGTAAQQEEEQSQQSKQPEAPSATFLEGAGRLVKGFGEGVLDTTSGIGSLIHKIPVIGPALVPKEGLDAENKLAEANSWQEKVGKFGETVAEFAGGDAALSGVVKLVHAPKALLLFPHNRLHQRYPTLPRR